jgi:hypothetical protein
VSRNPHPCDGVWIEAAPYRDLSLRSLRKVERLARDAGTVGWVIPESPWIADAVNGLGKSAIRIDLRRGARDSAHPADLERVLEVEPDLIGLPVHGLERLPDAALRANEQLVARAAEDDVDVVLLAQGTSAETAAIAAFAADHEAVLAVSVDIVDEEALDTLCRDETLCILTSGVEFASAYRHGAGAIDRFLGLVSPAAAVAFLALCSKDVTTALDVERRLQHFVETHVEPLRRRLAGDDEALGGILVALGGWCPALPAPDVAIDLEQLRRALAATCAELTPFLGP